MRKLGIIAVLSLLVVALAAVPALAVGPTSTTQQGGLHFVGNPDVTATKTNNPPEAFLTATGEVAGAGQRATATLAARADVTSGCVNRGSQGQEPSGQKRTISTVSGQQTFNTRSGRGTFTVSTDPVEGRNCPDTMRTVLISVTFTNVRLTITSGGNKVATANFPDIDP